MLLTCICNVCVYMHIFGHVNRYPWKHVPLDFENREILSMMDWTRLVSNLLKIIPKKLPRDCMLQGYMFASLI